jgi:tetratricopeptide (TPR) repeat protein
MRGCLLAILVLTLASGSPVTAQAPKPGAGSSVADVRRTLDAARKAIDEYRAAGGQPGAANHPALKWHEALWAYREKSPDSDAAAMATAEAIQLLIRAELRDQARERIAAVGVNDRGWERLSAYLYYDASARKDYAHAAETLTKVADSTHVASIKSATLLSLGRVQRRLGDTPAAVKSLESSRDAAPDTPSATEARALLYDIANLSIGLQAPAFSAKSLDGRPISLEGLRGRAVAMVFWGST